MDVIAYGRFHIGAHLNTNNDEKKNRVISRCDIADLAKRSLTIAHSIRMARRHSFAVSVGLFTCFSRHFSYGFSSFVTFALLYFIYLTHIFFVCLLLSLHIYFIHFRANDDDVELSYMRACTPAQDKCKNKTNPTKMKRKKQNIFLPFAFNKTQR